MGGVPIELYKGHAGSLVKGARLSPYLTLLCQWTIVLCGLQVWDPCPEILW